MAVETGCRFHRSFAFPDLIHAGLRVGHLGSSSVRYEISLFRNEDDEAVPRATSSMSSSTADAAAGADPDRDPRRARIPPPQPGVNKLWTNRGWSGG